MIENKYPARKSTRLKNWDYSSEGAYFITIWSHNHKNLCSRISVGAIHESPADYRAFLYEYADANLTSFGKIIQKTINKIPARFGVKITDYIIMPNHIHLVIWVENCSDERAIRESPLQKRDLISKIVGYLKMNSSKEIHKISEIEKIWQRNYHDHIIRNDEDYCRIAEYVFNNPGKWEEDCFYKQENN